MQFFLQGVLLFLPTYLITYLLFSILTLLKHTQQARRIGLPYAIFPVDQSNPWLRLIHSFRFVGYAVNNWLPGSLADRINDNSYEFRWTVKEREIQRLGRCYLRAAPGGLVVDITDAETAFYVFNSRNAFSKAYMQYGRETSLPSRSFPFSISLVHLHRAALFECCSGTSRSRWKC